MLEVDLQKSDAYIAASILSRCAEYGEAASVRIIRAPVPFAIIGMVNPQDSVEVAERLDACSFGPYVILNLEHASIAGNA